MDKLHHVVFKGVDSRTFGVVYVPSLPPIAERSTKTIEIPGRDEPINLLEPMRKNITLPVTLRTLDNHSSMDDISAWLQGEGDLILSTDPDKAYHAFVSSPISPQRLSGKFGNYPVVFNASPFRYSVFNPFIDYGVNLNVDTPVKELNIYCRGTADSEPLMYIEMAGDVKITVNGNEFNVESEGDFDGTVYKYYKQKIYIDSHSKTVYCIPPESSSLAGKYVITNKTRGTFPKFRHEGNIVRIEIIHNIVSDNETVTAFKCQNNERWY